MRVGRGYVTSETITRARRRIRRLTKKTTEISISRPLTRPTADKVVALRRLPGVSLCPRRVTAASLPPRVIAVAFPPLVLEADFVRSSPCFLLCTHPRARECLPFVSRGEALEREREGQSSGTDIGPTSKPEMRAPDESRDEISSSS